MSEIEFVTHYLSLAGRLKRYATYLTKSHEDSKDLYQQTTLRVLLARQKYDPTKSSLITWTAHIMANENSMARRPVGRNKITANSVCLELEDGLMELADPSCRTEALMDVDYWFGVVRRGSTPDWIEVGLLLHSGLTFTEIALIHARPEAELVSWYNNGRRKVRRYLRITPIRSDRILTVTHLLPSGGG